jgi:hypothetical protein
MKSLLKAVPLVVLLTVLFLYKFRYSLHIIKPEAQLIEAIDSSYLLNKIDKEIIARGTVMDKPFKGIDATKYPVKHLMNSSDALASEQTYSIKLFDESKNMEINVAIRDISLLNKIPFSLAFETGERILVTAYIKNNDGVNVMFGGTIHNNKGRLKLVGYNKNSKLVSGELDADLDAVIDVGACEIENLKFNNAMLIHNR